MNRRIYSLVAVLALGISRQSFAELAPQVTYNTGISPVSVAVGDFHDTNPTGILDLAVANESSNTVSILQGTGTGTFLAQHTTAAGTGPRAIATGDFNRDGWLDLVVVDSKGVAVLVNAKTATGTFNPPLIISTGFSTPEAVAVGDFNGDGCPDLAVTNFGNNTVTVLLNIRTGVCTATFGAPTTFPAGPGPSGIAVGDFFDQNPGPSGILDLAVVNSFAATVTILKGTGTGSFAISGTFSLSPATRALNGPKLIAVGDFNSDGYLDLVVAMDADTATATGQGGAVVLINKKTTPGSFLTAVLYPADAVPSSVAIGDFNGDGILDLVVANAFSEDISVLIGNGTAGVGDGTFQPAIDFPVGFLATSVAVGDFAGDDVGALPDDVVVTNFGFNNVSVLIGTE